MKKIICLLLVFCQLSLYAQDNKGLERLESLLITTANAADSAFGNTNPIRGGIESVLSDPAAKVLMDKFLNTGYDVIRFTLPKEMESDFNSIIANNRDAINDLIQDQLKTVVLDGKKSTKKILIDVTFGALEIFVKNHFKKKMVSHWGTAFEESIIDVLDSAKLGITIKNTRNIRDAVEVGKQSADIAIKYMKRAIAIAGSSKGYVKLITDLKNDEARVEYSFHITLNEYKALSAKPKNQLTSNERHRLVLLHNKIQSDINTYEKLSLIGFWNVFKDKKLRNEYAAFIDSKYEQKRYNPNADIVSLIGANTIQSGTSRGGSASSHFENRTKKDYTELIAITRSDNENLLVADNDNNQVIPPPVDPNPDPPAEGVISMSGINLLNEYYFHKTLMDTNLQLNVTDYGSINIPSGTALLALTATKDVYNPLYPDVDMYPQIELLYVIPEGVNYLEYEITFKMVSNDISYPDVSYPDTPIKAGRVGMISGTWTTNSLNTMTPINDLPAPFTSDSFQSKWIRYKAWNISVTAGETYKFWFYARNATKHNGETFGPTGGIIDSIVVKGKYIDPATNPQFGREVEILP